MYPKDAISSIFKEVHLTCPAWLSYWAPVTSSCLTKIYLKTADYYTLIFAFDQESAFFSVQCQLLTLVASGLSSTIHLNLKKRSVNVQKSLLLEVNPDGFDSKYLGSPSPHLAICKRGLTSKLLWKWGIRSFSRLLQNQHIWALGVWYTANVSNLFSQSHTMTRGTSGFKLILAKVVLLWSSFSHWSSRWVRLGFHWNCGTALCLHGLLWEMSVLAAVLMYIYGIINVPGFSSAAASIASSEASTASAGTFS